MFMNKFKRGDKVVHCYGNYGVGEVVACYRTSVLVKFEGKQVGTLGATHLHLKHSSVRPYIGF